MKLGVIEYFKDLIDKLLKMEIFRHVATLVSGSVVSQLIMLGVMPVLTRTYPNESLSIFFVFASTVSVFSILATLEYELAIVLPKNDIWSINLLVLSLIMNFIVSLILFCLISIFKVPLLKFLNCDVNGNWIFFVPVSVFFNGFFQAFSYWFNRFKRFKNMARAKISRSAVAGASQIGFSAVGNSGKLIIIGQLIGQLASIFTFLIDYNKYIRNLIRYISPKRIWFVAKKYKDIPIFNSTLDVMNSISNQLPIFLITKYFGLISTSYYGLSHRIIASPMGVITESFGQVFFQKASEIRNANEDLHNFVRKTYLSLFKIAIIPFLIVLIFAPFIFKIVFGSNYENAGTLTQILIPWLFVMFLNSPVTFLITVLNKQRQKIVYDSLLLAFRCASLIFGYMIFHDLFATIALFSLIGFLFNCYLIYYLLKISKCE